MDWSFKRVTLALAALALGYILFDLLLIFVISFLLIIASLPLVRYLKTKRIPRSISSVLIVFVVLALPVTILVSIGPALATQVSALTEQLPTLIERLESRTGLQVNETVKNQLSASVNQLPKTLFSLSASIITAVTSLIIILVLTIYGLIYYDKTAAGIVNFFAKDNQTKKQYKHILHRIERKVGSWVKGQFLISLIIGSLAWIAYQLLGLPFAGVLAILAGILELLPGIGATLAAIPALFIALTISPRTFFLTLVAYLIIQALESYVVTPKIMARVAKFNPLAILVIVLTGTYLLGIIGAFIAIPVSLICVEIYQALNHPGAASSK